MGRWVGGSVGRWVGGSVGRWVDGSIGRWICLFKINQSIERTVYKQF